MTIYIVGKSEKYRGKVLAEAHDDMEAKDLMIKAQMYYPQFSSVWMADKDGQRLEFN